MQDLIDNGKPMSFSEFFDSRFRLIRFTKFAFICKGDVTLYINGDLSVIKLSYPNIVTVTGKDGDSFEISGDKVKWVLVAQET